jgi:Succinylglutamate desuccinylase / Aspartoacylase family
LIRTWESPARGDVGDTVEDFLHLLGGPACIHLTGRDRTRTRAMTTLLHGNEPSGVRALHRFLKEGRQPTTDVVALVASVSAALEPPGFAHRMLPGRRDLNRCFAGPGADFEGRLAREIVQRLKDARPEAFIDLHNTSGSGPAYGVGTRVDPARLAMTSLFASHYVLTDIRLGSLMEATEDDFPTVTLECGGARNSMADRVAFEGLDRFLCTESLLEAAAARGDVTVLEHPVRVRLAAGAHVAYSNAPVASRALTLRNDIDQFNSVVLPSSEPIGWINKLEVLTAPDGSGVECLRTLFEIRDGRLHARGPLRLFMATTNERIAEEDCLFYAIPY